jgi:hypothetical protein
MVDLVTQLLSRLVHPLTLSPSGCRNSNPLAEGTAGHDPRRIRAQISAAQDAGKRPERPGCMSCRPPVAVAGILRTDDEPERCCPDCWLGWPLTPYRKGVTIAADKNGQPW